MRSPFTRAAFVFEKGSFTPSGAPSFLNPRIDYGRGSFSASILVGLSSPSGRRFEVDDVVSIVRDIRLAQAGDPGASLALQKGIYKHRESGEIVTEDSVRVFVLHLTDETIAEFREHILQLAEELVRALRQDEVIVEFSKRGVVEQVTGVTR